MAQQQAKFPRVGVIANGSPDTVFEALRQSFGQHGYVVEGRNIVIEHGHLDRVPELVAELVGLNVDVIVSLGAVGAAVAPESQHKDTYRVCGGDRSGCRRIRRHAGATRWERHGDHHGGCGSDMAARLACAAPQPKGLPVIGFFSAGSPGPFNDRIAAFRDGLRRAGFVEGRNVAIEFRWTESGYDQLPALAAELVDRRVDVLVTGNGAVVAKSATTSIPLVCLFPSDPVKSGLVASLNKPGSNLTGVSMFAFSLGPKRFELLHEVVPNAKRIVVLANPSQPDPGSKTDTNEVVAAAQAAGRQITVLDARDENDFEPAFATMLRQGAGGLIVMSDPYFNNRREQLVELAARHAIPAIYEWRETALAGGLMTYGSSLIDAFRHLGTYTGLVLGGAKPADLPVMQTIKVELVLNLKTAKTLGLTFPLPLLARADEVIE